MPRILETFANFWSPQSLLLLTNAQSTQGATEYTSVLWMLLSCGTPVHFNVRMITILWHMCVPAACVQPGTGQTGNHSVDTWTAQVWLQQHHLSSVLGQLTANMNNDVWSKTACNQLVQNTYNTAIRYEFKYRGSQQFVAQCLKVTSGLNIKQRPNTCHAWETIHLSSASGRTKKRKKI